MNTSWREERGQYMRQSNRHRGIQIAEQIKQIDKTEESSKLSVNNQKNHSSLDIKYLTHHEQHSYNNNSNKIIMPEHNLNEIHYYNNNSIYSVNNMSNQSYPSEYFLNSSKHPQNHLVINENQQQIPLMSPNLPYNPRNKVQQTYGFSGKVEKKKTLKHKDNDVEQTKNLINNLTKHIKGLQIRISQVQNSLKTGEKSEFSKSFQQLPQIAKIIEQTKSYQIKNQEINSQMLDDLKNKISRLREQIDSSVKQQNYDLQMIKISNSIEEISKEVSEISSDKLIQQVQNKFYQLKIQLEIETKKQLSEICQSLSSRIGKIRISERVLEGKILTLHYQQTASLIGDLGSSKPAVLSTRTYYLDEKGYLLNYQKKYLIDQHNQEIKLSVPQIEILRKAGILL